MPRPKAGARGLTSPGPSSRPWASTAPLEPCTTDEYPTPARRPENSVLENARLVDEGLNVMVPWADDVREYARRHRARLLDEAQPA